MTDSFEEQLPQNITSRYETDDDVEDPLYSALLANIIFNGCFCYTTIMLNIVTIHALRKTSLSKPLKTLLLSLAVSDLGIGLLGQPLEIVYLMEMLQWKHPSRATNIASAIVLNGFYLSSLCSIMAISADRFIAIQMPLRYNDIVTHKRVITTVIIIWLFSALLSPCSVLVLTANIAFVIFVVIELVFFAATTLFYYKIYLTIRRHKEQIQSQIHQLLQNGEVAVNTDNTARFGKSAHSTFCICLVFWVCYLPHLFISIARQIHASQIIITLYVFSETLVLLNSSLNPVIYCWKMRHIRHTIMDILRNLFRSYNGG